MSECIFLAAGCPLRELSPAEDYPLEVNVDLGTVCDGDADDNFFLRRFDEAGSYSALPYGVQLEWAYYTEGRARRILDYIEALLRETDRVELWKVWLDGCYHEAEERPFVHRCTVPFRDLTTEDIREINDAEVWNRPDPRHPTRPSFYCLTINR